MRARLLPLLLPLLVLAAPAHAGVVGTGMSGDEVAVAYQPRKLALVIGIDDYDDPLFQPLSFAAADAIAMADVLADPDAGGFDRVELYVSAERTSLASVRAGMDELLNGVEPQDTVLVYVSAHGTLALDWERQADLFVVTRDTMKGDLAGTGLRVSELQDTVGDSRAHRKVLIVDACHHGQGKSAVTPETMALLTAAKGEAEPTLREPERDFEAHLFASTFGLPALEDAALGHGVYTHYLVQAMSADADRADRDGDGLVSVSEAHDYARDATIEHTGAVQVPRALYSIVGREDIFLAGDEASRSVAEAGLLFSYDTFYGDCSVEVDGRFAGMLPRGLPLEPGSRRVTVTTPAGQVLVDRRVEAVAGQTIDVGSLHRASRPGGGRLGASAGLLMGLGSQSLSPFGGPLVGLSVQAGVSFPVRRPVRAHLRADVGWHAGRYDVPHGGARFTADVHAVRVGGTFAVHLRVRRFGLLLGPRLGALLLLRPPVEEGGPEGPHRFAVEPGLLLEPSLSLVGGLSLSLPVVLSLTSDLMHAGGPPVQGYLQVGAGVTWSFR